MAKQKKKAKKVFKVIGIVLLAMVGVVALVFGTLTVTEYKPDDEEAIAVEGESTETLSLGDTFTVMTWNTGYGALGDNADFFMDGGTHVYTADKDRVQENMAAIEDEVASVDPDIIFFQEVDTGASRSHHIDETESLSSALSGYETSYALNYKVLYIPYPWPPLGQVNAGIYTMSKYEMTDSTRVQLPCPFSWPVSIVNLKRCLLVSRIPIEGTDSELVIVNLHLEAYDNGEGKAAQTAMLKELLEEEVEAGNYVIAGGDFNQAFSNVDTSQAAPLVSEDLWQPGNIDVSEFTGLTFFADDSLPSCRSLDQAYAGADDDDFQFYIIDGFIVSDNLTVESVETQDMQFANSDHNPMVLTVSIN